MKKLCLGCNTNEVDEKQDESVFYCDECLLKVSIAAQKIKEYMESLS